ncbi:MAG: hypothetical protein GY874_18700 [Desulfobacteraceae bacterium]|nr:hypothetical protein [Desulfobacteraceae bacterium]
MNQIRSYTPLLITLIGGLLITVLAMLRIAKEPFGPGKILACLTVVIYFLWKIIESRITVAETSQGQNHDKGTVEMCAAVEIGLLAAVFLKSAPVNSALATAGLSVMAVGLALRFAAIAALGKDYTLRIRAISDLVVDIGPYSWVRHPSYLGTLIVHTGLVLVFPGVAPFLFLALWFFAVTFRALIEDRFLMQNRMYKIYSTHTKQLIFPGLL